MTRREQYITGLRQLADFLAVNPDVPVPVMDWELPVPIVDGSDGERVVRVQEVTAAMGVEPVWERARFGGELRFGPVVYAVFMHPAAHMQDWRDQQELGRVALAARKAAEAANEDDSAELLRVPFVKASPAEVAQAFESSAEYGRRVSLHAAGGA